MNGEASGVQRCTGVVTLDGVDVEHDIDLVMGLCSRICVLHLGEVIASGTPDEVGNSAAVQEAYLGAAV